MISLFALLAKLIENPRASVLLFLAFVSVTSLPCYMIYRVEVGVNRLAYIVDRLTDRLECDQKIHVGEKQERVANAIQH
jgi:hypothetical protein